MENMEDFKQGFVEEATQLVDCIEELLMELESRSAIDGDIQEIFRTMHTIKGSASMFAYSKTEKITHSLEDVYDLIRNNKLALSADIIHLTIKATDLSRELLKNNDALTISSEEEYESVIDAAASLVKSNTTPIDTPGTSGNFEEEFRNSPTIINKDKIYYVCFKPDTDVLHRGIVPISVFDELEELGRITGYPYIEDVPTPEQFDPSLFYISWDIFIKTEESKDDIEDCFLFYLSHEYKVIEINPLQLNTNQDFLDNCINLSKGLLTVDQITEKLDLLLSNSDGMEQIEATKTPVEEKKPKVVDENKSLDTIKVESGKLDELINLVSDLVTLNSQLEILSSKIEDNSLAKTVKSVSRLSKKFRDNALELRLIPVKVLVLKMQRLIRDLSLNLNKDVEFITEGTNTELDKNIIAKLEAPLMHILRNSVDHGIESAHIRTALNKPEKGVIRFVAFYSGSNVYIQIQDDGKGIDVETIRNKAIEKGLISSSDTLSKQDVFDLLFAPGFSTAENVSKVSGRGVGLDVVKKEITAMRGEIDIESEKDLGSSITLKLPLTLSIIDTLMVRVDETSILIPREYIVHTNILNRKSKEEKIDKIEFKDNIIPVIKLRDDFASTSELPNKENYVVISQYDKYYAITVDNILGEHQAVVKPLGYYNQNHNYFSGASILGDGSLAFILDINKLISNKKNNSNVGNYNLK